MCERDGLQIIWACRICFLQFIGQPVRTVRVSRARARSRSPSGPLRRLAMHAGGHSLRTRQNLLSKGMMRYYSLPYWSFIMITMGVAASGLEGGAMISSMSVRRASESAWMSAFSHTLDANLCRAMNSKRPRSWATINALSSARRPCSRINWIT